MIGKTDKTPQLNIFKIPLNQFINLNHELCLLSKKNEFGNKTSIVKTRKSGIIVGVLAFKENIYDGDTLEPQLEQVERLTNYQP